MFLKKIKNRIGYLIENVYGKNIIPDRSTIILMFHRLCIENQHNIFENNLRITNFSFENCIKYFLRHDVEFIDLSEWLKKRENGKKYCIITFDDGWYDNYQIGFPIIKKYNLPVTIFLTTNFINSNENLWFDDVNEIFKGINSLEINKKAIKFFQKTIIDHNYKVKKFADLYTYIIEKLKYMSAEDCLSWIQRLKEELQIIKIKDRKSLNWKEIELMSQNKVSFGSHGLNHFIIPNLKSYQKQTEIQLSKKILESKNNINFQPLFSFPNGIIDKESVKMALQCGYKAVLTASKANCIIKSPQILNRVCVSQINFSNDNSIAYRLFLARKRKEFINHSV